MRTGARREPNTRATVAELFAGCEAYSQNRWPSLSFDFGAINSLFSPILVAGFYYKTFMWPRKFWEKLYEPAIRRAAGLGRASAEPDPDRYEKAHLFCDVLVIGGGPAGLAAALTAARSGARVVLCDEDFVLGGRLNSERHEIDGGSGSDWARKVEAELASMADVRILRRTTVFGAYDGEFGAVERVSDHLPVPPAHLPRQRLWKIIAKRSILATGAVERPIVFGGNDRPGVMMASAVRTYVNRFGVAPGRKVALFTTTDDGWKTAADLAKAGVAVEAVIDARRDATAPMKVNRAWFGAQVIDTHGSSSLRAHHCSRSRWQHNAPERRHARRLGGLEPRHRTDNPPGPAAEMVQRHRRLCARRAAARNVCGRRSNRRPGPVRRAEVGLTSGRRRGQRRWQASH